MGMALFGQAALCRGRSPCLPRHKGLLRNDMGGHGDPPLPPDSAHLSEKGHAQIFSPSLSLDASAWRVMTYAKAALRRLRRLRRLALSCRRRSAATSKPLSANNLRMHFTW